MNGFVPLQSSAQSHAVGQRVGVTPQRHHPGTLGPVMAWGSELPQHGDTSLLGHMH